VESANPPPHNPSKIEAPDGDGWRAGCELSNLNAQLVVLSIRRLSAYETYKLTHDLIFHSVPAR
jgi:hypothetical protein